MKDTWENDIPFSRQEKIHINLLRVAGCKCDLPLLGYIPGKGPRCRVCGIEASDNIIPQLCNGCRITMHDALTNPNASCNHDR